MKIVLFKRPKPRQFNYRPLYYDPEKEAAEERKKALNGLQDGDPKERMRAEIRRRWRTERKAVDNKNRFFRIFFYGIFTFFILYLLFFTDFVEKMVYLFFR
jgi:hypothetical protein